ncbi:unnamed protein product [Malus baccata var. baccata]
MASLRGEATEHDIVRFGPRPCPHGFISKNSHENFLVGHPFWECSRPNSLNFGVPIEPKASEFPKSLVLYGGGHHDIVRFGPWPHPHGFVSGNSDENFLVGHSSWYYSCPNSLNFGVSMEPEASEFPKGLVLYGGGHVHIRHITHSPLVDMGCYIN